MRPHSHRFPRFYGGAVPYDGAEALRDWADMEDDEVELYVCDDDLSDDVRREAVEVLEQRRMQEV